MSATTWSELFPHHSSQIVEMDRAECLELLEAKRVGRLAYSSPDGPRIFPLNYAYHDNRIVMRTVASGEIDRYAIDAACAFEIDDIDEFYATGWSVTVTGIAKRLTGREQAELPFGRVPEPWVGGIRPLFVGIETLEVYGRRLLPSGLRP
jgi:hypothetical protein